MKRLLRAALVVIGLLVVLAAAAFVAIHLSRPPRTDDQAQLFQGVTYSRHVRSTPRPLMIHVVAIDLSAPGTALLVTPGDEGCGLELCASTTSEFLDKFDLQIAINGGFFEPFQSRDYTLWDYYPHSGDPVNIKGLAISNGERYSEDDPRYSAKLCITNSHAQITDTRCPPDTTQALAGSGIIVERGKPAVRDVGASRDRVHPRTAVALDAQGKALWLIVVDGRQPGYSEGVTLAELADIVLALGAETALNLDGGGSSTLVIAGPLGARILNAPIHTRIPMRERPVGNHLGIYALPAGTH